MSGLNGGVGGSVVTISCYTEKKLLWMCSWLAERSTVILRSAVQNDLMLRNRRVSRVRAEMLWRHFLHADKDLPSFRSFPGKESERVPPAPCPPHWRNITDNTLFTHTTSPLLWKKVPSPFYVSWSFLHISWAQSPSIPDFTTTHSLRSSKQKIKMA